MQFLVDFAKYIWLLVKIVGMIVLLEILLEVFIENIVKIIKNLVHKKKK